MNAEKRALMGARLKEERARLRLSQDELGGVCDVKRRTLQDWERGVNAPNGEFLATAAEHGVDVLYVLTGKRSGAAMQGIGHAWITPEETELLDRFRSAAAPLRGALREIVGALARSDEIKNGIPIRDIEDADRH